MRLYIRSRGEIPPPKVCCRSQPTGFMDLVAERAFVAVLFDLSTVARRSRYRPHASLYEGPIAYTTNILKVIKELKKGVKQCSRGGFKRRGGRAWTLLRFFESKMFQLSKCNSCESRVCEPCPYARRPIKLSMRAFVIRHRVQENPVQRRKKATEK